MDDWRKYSDSWRIPLRSIYREVIDFRLEANASNYIQVGWQPIGFQYEPADIIRRIRVKKAIPLYRVGWPRGAGEPPRPPIIDEGLPPRTQDFGPSPS
jgi:hypothetical protein